MQREQKEVETSSGKKVVIKTYLTGAESNELKRVLFSGVTVDTEKKTNSISLTSSLDREVKLIELAVISLEGSTEGLVEKVQNLPSHEYDALIKTIETDLKLNFQTAK